MSADSLCQRTTALLAAITLAAGAGSVVAAQQEPATNDAVASRLSTLNSPSLNPIMAPPAAQVMLPLSANPQHGLAVRNETVGQTNLPAEPLKKTAFQEFVTTSVGTAVPLFGYDLFETVPSTFSPVDSAPVTADYVIGPGDEIQLRAWGQIEADHRLIVDRAGAINIPAVGTLNVAGIKFQDLRQHLHTAIARNFRNFEISVNLGQLRSIQVFVVGQARRPGKYTVSSLSTLMNALFASGGPAAAGSMRQVQLRRGDTLVTEFDLYALLLKGDKTRDAPLQPGDVIFIPPAGPRVAVTGSVNLPAIFELKDSATGNTANAANTLADLFTWAGGVAVTAGNAKISVERIDSQRERQLSEFSLAAADQSRPLQDGDLVRVTPISPQIRNAVTLRGNVAQPARVPWREGLRVADVIPGKEALITRDYWVKRNETILPVGAATAQSPLLTEVDALTAGTKTKKVEVAELLNDVKNTLKEVNWHYAVVERLNWDNLTTTLLPFNLAKAVLENDAEENLLLKPGDVITIFSKQDIQVPIAQQSKFVRLEGELVRPGIYQVSPGETLRQLIQRTGGVTANAYLFSAEFTRLSTRQMQQKKLAESLDKMELELERSAADRISKSTAAKAVGGIGSTVNTGSSNPTNVSVNQVAEASQFAAMQIQAEVEYQRSLLKRLRDVKATGRIVLELKPESSHIDDLPDLILEDGDRLLVQPRPSTVMVMGSVFNENTFLYKPEKTVEHYLDHAGGLTRGADSDTQFILQADGTVVSKRQGGSSWLGLGSGFESRKLNPGDAIIVPEQTEKFSWSKTLSDWSQTFFQFGLGAAGLKVLKGL